MPLDPITQNFIEQAKAAGLRPFEKLTPAEARAQFALPPGDETFGSEIRDITIPAGDAELQARLYIPKDPQGVIVYFHGGGFVIGDIQSFASVGDRLAATCNCVVALVEYRLAPEHPFPAAVDDAYFSTQWFADNCETLFGKALPLIVAGDSAGGNLAAVTALRARDRNGPDIDMQILIYPTTGTDFDLPSFKEPENQLILTLDSMHWFWDHYLPDLTKRDTPDASPLSASDLGGLPRTLIMTAEYDVLRDEGAQYAERLKAEGNAVEFVCYEGQMHGFLPRFQLPGSALAFRQIAASVGDLLQNRKD